MIPSLNGATRVFDANPFEVETEGFLSLGLAFCWVIGLNLKRRLHRGAIAKVPHGEETADLELHKLATGRPRPKAPWRAKGDVQKEGNPMVRETRPRTDFDVGGDRKADGR